MSKNTGFTLTELIITIIIFSILSLSALPKFLNLNDDATQASLKGHKAALVDSLALLKGKHIIAGEPNQLVLNGYTLNFFVGNNHPSAIHTHQDCKNIWLSLMQSGDIDIQRDHATCEYKPFKDSGLITYNSETGIVSIK